MNKYFEIVPISEKPEKDGWYDLINPEGVYKSTSAYFSNGKWSKIESYEIDNYSHYYRPITSLPIDREQAEKIWAAAREEVVYPDTSCGKGVGGQLMTSRAKYNTVDDFLKQFE